MPGTITTDLLMISSADTTTSSGAWSAGTVDADAKIEGAACLYVKYSSTGQKEITFTPTTNENLTSTRLYFWVSWASKSMPATVASSGLFMRLTTDSTHWSEWLVAGSDTLPHNGWICHVVDVDSTPDKIGTNPVTINNVDIISLKMNLAVKGNFSWDAIRKGKKMSVKGGTAAAPVTFADLLTADQTYGYGIVGYNEGIYILQGDLDIGSTVANEYTYFKDTSKIVAIANKKIAAGYFDISIVGAAGTSGTKAYFGSKSGNSGISGLVLKTAAASSSYRVIATNENIQELGIYGSSFIDATTVSLPTAAITGTREVLNSNFEACGVVSANTCSVANGNFVGSDAGAVVINSTSFAVSGMNFINCPVAVTMPACGSYNFYGMKFSGNTIDIDNTSGNQIIINCSDSTPSQAKTTGNTTIINTVNLTLTTLAASSEVHIYTHGTTAELGSGIEYSDTSYVYSYTYSAETYVDIVVHKEDKIYWRLDNYLLGSTSTSLPVTQQTDRQYYNPPGP